MLGKLMKYDLRSMIRVFVPLWLLTPILALLLSFSIRMSVGQAEYSSMLGRDLALTILLIVTCLLFACVMIGLLATTTVLIIQRFWKGLLKEEGYLMFTLPVEPWQLITSKGLTATIVSFISGTVAVLSCVMLFLASSDDVILGFMQVWNFFWRSIDVEFGPSFWIVVVLFVILMVLSTAQSVYQMYASMAIGQLWQGHRVLGACLSFVGLSIALSVLGNIVGTIADAFLPDDWVYWVSQNALAFAILYQLVLILGTVIAIAVYHIITERILTTRLNLE